MWNIAEALSTTCKPFVDDEQTNLLPATPPPHTHELPGDGPREDSPSLDTQIHKALRRDSVQEAASADDADDEAGESPQSLPRSGSNLSFADDSCAYAPTPLLRSGCCATRLLQAYQSQLEAFLEPCFGNTYGLQDTRRPRGASLEREPDKAPQQRAMVPTKVSTKVSTKLTKASTMHAAGIFADMTVDGPEIGTLVVIVDRAKNLPNKKTVGKQDPYCACRLGKEAKKTETDKRGGQVSRWDQELRFTVRDSPDYYNLKVSIFNDDKKTELIGESYVDLIDVIKAGGGQSDIWHNLNCKGKYAGEVRLEMTYYDSRPKPEKSAADEQAPEQVRDASGSRKNTPVRRRPLPTDPIGLGGSPAEQARPLPPAGGPREYGTPSRPLPQPQGRSSGNTPSSQRRKTIPSSGLPQPVDSGPSGQQQSYPETPDDVFAQKQYPQHSQDPYSPYGDYDTQPQNVAPHQYQDNPTTGLPELPPMMTPRRPGAHRSSVDLLKQEQSYGITPQQPELHHSHSAPQVPVQAPYPEDMLNPRTAMHHAQSDTYLVHGQTPATHHPDVPPQQRQAYPPQPYAQDFHEQYHEHEPPQPAQSAVPHVYNQTPQASRYRQPSDQSAQAPTNHHQIEAPPPPPPAHRDSAPRQESYSAYAPAPLNITPSRRSPSPMMYQEPEQYSSPVSYRQPQDYGGRRNTLPVNVSPQEPHIHRPRAMSGDAMRDQSRPSTRDGQYALQPSHPDYYSPTTGTPPNSSHNRVTPARHRDSYRPSQQSPLTMESPQSFRGDIASLPSQQSSPYRSGNRSVGPSPPKPSPISQRPFVHHHAASEPHIPTANYQTPPRQHPLAQQVPYGSSPSAYSRATPPHEQMPLVKPIALPPSSFSTPSSEPRMSRMAQRSTPMMRKSISPQPSQSTGAPRSPGTIFSPDSFDQFNPAARSSTTSLINHPATSSHGSSPAHNTPVTRDGKIIDFHGNHIDPSDRLPETAWAPEPDPKGPQKDKPYRERERIGGARDLNVTMVNKTSPRVSFGSKTPADDSSGGAGMIRARLRKKERPASSIVLGTSNHDRPFRDIPNPAGPTGYSPPSWDRRGSGHSPGGGYDGSQGGYGAASGGVPYYGNGSGPPPIPAKVPFDPYTRHQETDALSRELSNIDIGGSAGRGRFSRNRLLDFRN